MLPFGKVLLYLEDVKAETGNKLLPDFSFQEELYPNLAKPEYLICLGSSNSRKQEDYDGPVSLT